MSREKNLKRLKASLRETQTILGDLVAGTSKDTSKRLTTANKRLQNTYEDASSELQAVLNDTSKDVRKQYYSTTKDLNKQASKAAAKAKDQLNYRLADTSAAARAAKASLGAGALALAAKADLPSRAANAASFIAKTGLAAKAVELATKADLKNRTANVLEGAAGGFINARNRLNPKNKVVIRSESYKGNISKAGYFVRFSALAIIIISKRHKLMELGTQLYNKVKDADGRAQLTQDAKDQFNTFGRLIKAYSNGQYRELPYRSLVKIVAAVVYFVSVADLIPDFIPVLGLTDDLAILAWVFSSVKDDLQQFVDWEAAEEKRRNRLANKSESTTAGQSSSKTESSSSASGSVANVGNASAPDRKASPNVTTSTGVETGSKATVTTGTSGTGSSGSASGNTGSGSTTGSAGNTGGASNSGTRPGSANLGGSNPA